MTDIVAEESVVGLGLRLHDRHSGAGFGCGQGGADAGIAAADNNDIGLHGIRDRSLIDLRRRPQPIEVGQIARLNRPVGCRGLARGSHGTARGSGLLGSASRQTDQSAPGTGRKRAREE